MVASVESSVREDLMPHIRYDVMRVENEDASDDAHTWDAAADVMLTLGRPAQARCRIH